MERKSQISDMYAIPGYDHEVYTRGPFAGSVLYSDVHGRNRYLWTGDSFYLLDEASNSWQPIGDMLPEVARVPRNGLLKAVGAVGTAAFFGGLIIRSQLSKKDNPKSDVSPLPEIADDVTEIPDKLAFAKFEYMNRTFYGNDWPLVLRWKDLIDKYVKVTPYGNTGKSLSDILTENHINPVLLGLIIIYIESSGIQDRVSNAGAVGLMGVMPKEKIAGRPSHNELLQADVNIQTGLSILSNYIWEKQSISAGLNRYYGDTLTYSRLATAVYKAVSAKKPETAGKTNTEFGNIPGSYELVTQAAGVEIFADKKQSDKHTQTLASLVHLDQGASIMPIYQPASETGKPKTTFAHLYLKDMQKLAPSAFIHFTGSFRGVEPANQNCLNYPLKSDGQIITPGYFDPRENYVGLWRMMAFGNGKVAILPADSSESVQSALTDNKYQTIITGLSIDAPKDSERKVGRTCIGVLPDGKTLVMISKFGATQEDMVAEFDKWNVPRENIVMFDGASPTKRGISGKPEYAFDLTLPNAYALMGLGVLAAPITRVDFLKMLINDPFGAMGLVPVRRT